MKFCNLLRETAEGLPEIWDLYVAYKCLKKILREAVQCRESGDVESCTELQHQFISDVNSCLQHVNESFIEKEEEVVIQFDSLERAANAVQSMSESQSLAQRITDFHGQLLLLMNTTMLAYVCILKIMKKYSKKTGQIVPSLQPDQLKEMPIGSTEIISSIVYQSEHTINTLLSRQSQFANTSCSSTEMIVLSEEQQRQRTQSQSMTSSFVEQIRLALGTWEQLKTTAVTPSTVLTERIFTMASTSASTSVSSTSSSVQSEAS
eukprot:g1732.t1